MPRPAFVSAAAVIATHRLSAPAVSSARSPFVAARPSRPALCTNPRSASPLRHIASASMADFTSAANGLKYKDVVVGTGPEVTTATSGKNVNVHYVLTLNGYSEENGTKVDSSRDRGRPFSYRCLSGSVIQGWDQGVLGMKVGGNRRLIIPPELGYGAGGAGGVIPGGATLYFDIELLSIDN